MNYYKTILGVLIGLVGMYTLLYLCHFVGDVPAPKPDHYKYTNYISDCFGLKFGFAYFVLSIALGWTTNLKKQIAWGMIAPLAIAAYIEINNDPTDHNLLGIEVVMFWLPAFLLALVGAIIGCKIRNYFAGYFAN